MLAALFLGLFALALTISPAIRARAWDADYRWSHWLGVAVWLVGFGLIGGWWPYLALSVVFVGVHTGHWGQVYTLVMRK